MSNITFYHNPRCSKSRQALALLEEQGAALVIHCYLESPLSQAALTSLLARLEGGLNALVRDNEAEWKTQGLSLDDEDAVLAALAREPRLMQRPIADDGQRAIVGRPPELVLALLDHA